MNASSIWDHLLSRVEARNNRFAFSTWFKPVRFISDDGVALRVAVPNALFRDWFLKHYAPIVEETLAELERGGTTVSYLTDERTTGASTNSGFGAHGTGGAGEPGRPAS
jgi:chromosomal replication initiation ATPase DnaA